MKKKALFIDRDGVVNYRIVKDYVKSTEEFHFIPDFLVFFPEVVKAQYLTILITNQQGVSKGVMTLDALLEINDYMQESLQKLTGSCFDDIYFCTDSAESNSFYRKPNPGMLLSAIKKWNIETSSSWMLGDSIKDAEAGKKAGLKTILIGSFTKEEAPAADFIVKDFYEVGSILKKF